jgi:hypothetical protein
MSSIWLVLVKVISTGAAVEAAPLNTEFIDFQVAAGFSAVVRAPGVAAFRAGRVAAAFPVIRQGKAMLAAEIEGAAHDNPPPPLKYFFSNCSA